MLRGAVDGVGADETAERLTHERIRAYAAANATVYLVAHDPETAARLAERRPSSDRGGGDGVIAFETSIGVERPIEEVFAYVSDPRQLPALELGRPDVLDLGGPTVRARRTRWSGSYRAGAQPTSSRS